ncbi:response regulator transcription factor [Mobiluncus mulieris]|uniref:Response regulator transcription factor n=1 Tax=Mobiluncus mulieris TaxID=2052 RepID=A0ABD4TXV4_9ACTO|nr:response regulator transcription factor [Mobiluncus mulieris]EFN92685.1 response regulator receiver domain protein [Mobiluncus mulieris FB024-16]MCU9968805.1 response regulator transcription factor [Mobiluncus mulieris]MCU9971255.1 response regulator transcription factor [Mobiluncus mulieris]MCU9996531.1 response regulator transcription factor [Mobiluncus mulieris]MCV0012216.1 response regulator transcription factor [Mobiluncus mulieris]
MSQTEAWKALVLDDDPHIASVITFSLETRGFSWETASTGREAWAMLRKKHFDLAVLDVMLPDMSGVDLTRRIRAAFSIPIILVSALGEESERIAGLEAGADDYIVKPFSPRELALRAELAVKHGTGATPNAGLVTNGPLSLDLQSGSAVWDSERLDLTDIEFRFLVALASRIGNVVSISDLLNEVWQTQEIAGGRDMIKSTVYRLRKNLAGITPPDLIVNVRGLGYSMQKL